MNLRSLPESSQKSRWLLLKREENLKTEQRFRLRDLLRYNLRTVRANLLKGSISATLGLQLRHLGWEVPRRMVLSGDALAHRTDEENRPFTARTPRANPQLLPRLKKLLSSGVVEGLNNKAKVTMRKSYGFRTFRCLELALYHSLGKLPEPESTHEFF